MRTYLQNVLGMVGLRGYEVSGPKELFQLLQLPGDWIVRTKTSRQARPDALETIIRETTGHRMRFTTRKAERPVIVVRGEYPFSPDPRVQCDRDSVHIFAEKLDSDDHAGGGSGNFEHFLA